MAESPNEWRTLRVPKGVLLLVAAAQVLLASGEAYGWTALRPVLQDGGYFDSYGPVERASKFSIVATAGIAANALCKLPLGWLLDRCGPRATSSLGCLMLISGSLLIALGEPQSLLHVAGGYFLLGTSGPFIQMPCFQFSNLFPGNQGSVITLLIASFEMSTGVFFAFNLLHFSHLGLSANALFFGYAVTGGLFLLTTLVLWPDHAYSPEEQEPCEEGSPPESSVEVTADQVAAGFKNEDGEAEAGESSLHPLSMQPIWRQFLSWEFAYVAAFLVIHIFRQGFVLTTVYMQLLHFFGPGQDSVAHLLADVFSVFLPLGFIPMLLYSATGCSAYLLSRPNLSFFVATVCSMAYGLLFLWPSVPSYLALFLLFPIARQLTYSTFFSYCVNTFGYATFGQISGVACFIAGAVQLSQWLLIEMASNPESPISWATVNVILATVPAVLLVPVACRSLRTLVEECDVGEAVTIQQPLLQQGAPGDGDGTAAVRVGVGIPRRVHASSGGGIPLLGSRGSLSLFPAACGSHPTDTPGFGSSVMSFNSLRGSPVWSMGSGGAQHEQQGGSFTSTLYGTMDQR